MRSIKSQPHRGLILTLLLFILIPDISSAQVKVVNMIPYDRSNETNQDSEPNLAVNPANPLEIVGSAFTPDPMEDLASALFTSGVVDGAGWPEGIPPPPLGEVTNAPIYISIDGGNSWELRSIVEGGNFVTGTNDITVRFGGSSGILYAALLRGDQFFNPPLSGLRMNINRTIDFKNETLMEVLTERDYIDQPYIQATTVLGGSGSGNDRVYVGNNDLNYSPLVFPDLFDISGRTATVDRSLNASSSAYVEFESFVIESQVTAGQDAPAIRTAVHPNGTIYGTFYRFTSMPENSTYCYADVIVVRDDNWGIGANPFTDLVSPIDGLPGRPVAFRRIPVVNQSQADFGQERFVASDISIAVDPRNSSTVYVAWADAPSLPTENVYILHVCRSTDCGVTWAMDMLTIINAKNPALAINMRGKIGFLYQALTGEGDNQRWVTHFRRSNDGTTWGDLILADVPANAPDYRFLPYIGDYVHLMAVGKDFYGVFSANNTPDPAHFPQGVTYQRLARFDTKRLLNHLDLMPTVDISIDPFFFKVTELAGYSDFYVRDWTNDATDHDIGLEPSINPVFFHTSDVWSRRSNSGGGFNANDQPKHEAPQTIFTGGNFAFARVHRKAKGSAKAVELHFLKSELGIGSNYQDASTTPHPTLDFAEGDSVKTLTQGHQWALANISSSHVCLAVEISTPDDSIVAPSLLGRAPGWPKTDLTVLNDNNKAQRNTGVYSTFPGEFEFYAIAHNADVSPRDMRIRYEIAPEALEHFREPRIEIIGGSGKSYFFENTITLANMQPGENRWIKLTIQTSADTTIGLLPVEFCEIVDGLDCGGEMVINGFILAAQPSTLIEVMRRNLEFHCENFTRMGVAFNMDRATEEGKAAAALLSNQEISKDEYAKFLRSHINTMKTLFAFVRSSQGSNDPFRIQTGLQNLERFVRSGDSSCVVAAHSSVLHRLDSFLTMLQKLQGDPADILQSVGWQQELYAKLPQLKKLDFSDTLRGKSQQFILAYGMRKAGNDDYRKLISELLESFRKTAIALSSEDIRLDQDIINMESNLNSPAALQKAHRAYLLKLQGLEN